MIRKWPTVVVVCMILAGSLGLATAVGGTFCPASWCFPTSDKCYQVAPADGTAIPVTSETCTGPCSLCSGSDFTARFCVKTYADHPTWTCTGNSQQACGTTKNGSYGWNFERHLCVCITGDTPVGTCFVFDCTY